MRISALLDLFGIPVREAGTLCLIVSIPTVAAGTIADRFTRQLPNPILVTAVFMAAASMAGVVIGGAFLPYVDRDAIKGMLGVILVLATARLAAASERDSSPPSRRTM